MPTFDDGKGGKKFHMNPQMGKSMSRGGGKAEEKPSTPAEKTNDNGGSISLHAHGDGSYHTEKDGETTEHPHLGHALTHMASHMEPGKHTHIHSEGGMHHTHHLSEDGTHNGPHDEQNLDELTSDLSQFLGEEKQESREEAKEPNHSYGSKPAGHSGVADMMF